MSEQKPNAESVRPSILDGSHYCDIKGEHRNDKCASDDHCVCSLCGTFWLWNVQDWERAQKMRRPDWDSYFLDIARAVAARADCRRAQHGCVLVDGERRIVSTGYNGSPHGGPSCLAGDCPRGLKSPDDVAHNHGDYSDCIALHAEQNAVAYADRSRTGGGTAYITGAPCDMCGKVLMAAGVAVVRWPNGERTL
jgi:dCMP deaminase